MSTSAYNLAGHVLWPKTSSLHPAYKPWLMGPPTLHFGSPVFILIPPLLQRSLSRTPVLALDLANSPSSFNCHLNIRKPQNPWAETTVPLDPMSCPWHHFHLFQLLVHASAPLPLNSHPRDTELFPSDVFLPLHPVSPCLACSRDLSDRCLMETSGACCCEKWASTVRKALYKSPIALLRFFIRVRLPLSCHL